MGKLNLLLLLLLLLFPLPSSSSSSHLALPSPPPPLSLPLSSSLTPFLTPSGIKWRQERSGSQCTFCAGEIFLQTRAKAKETPHHQQGRNIGHRPLKMTTPHATHMNHTSGPKLHSFTSFFPVLSLSSHLSHNSSLSLSLALSLSLSH